MNQSTLQNGTPYELDLEFIGAGPTKWMTSRGEPLRDTEGRIIGLRGTAQDITERKRADEALRESEEKLRLILESTTEAIYGSDREARYTFCNPACLRLLGYERVDDLLGKDMHRLMHHTRLGLGLISMQERLKLLNGTLIIESQLQRGTTIRASVSHRSNTGPTVGQ